MSIWSEYGTFWRETRRHFRTTGAVLPSSPFLACALVYPLNHHRKPAQILEVGPGTGAITRAIARRLRDGDHLDAVELNAKFVDQLRRRIDNEPIFADHQDRIDVINSAVQDLPGEARYDFIISGLPFNSFPRRAGEDDLPGVPAIAETRRRAFLLRVRSPFGRFRRPSSIESSAAGSTASGALSISTSRRFRSTASGCL